MRQRLHLVRTPTTPGCRIGPDGTPAAPTVTERAGTCARHTDELARLVEDAEGLIGAQALAIGEGDLLTAVTVGIRVRTALCCVAASLGELHVSLDELSAGR